MTSTRERAAWVHRAECRDQPDWDESCRWRAQLQVCARCPVSLPCLEMALELQIGGIRGGTTMRQRKQILGDHRKLLWDGVERWVTMRDGRPDPSRYDGLVDACARVMAYGTEELMPQGRTLRTRDLAAGRTV